MLCRKWHQISLTLLLVHCRDVSYGIVFVRSKMCPERFFILNDTSHKMIFWPQTEKLDLPQYKSPSFALTAEG